MTRQEKYPNTKLFTYYNANPKNRITGDCRIRALCTALNVPYNDIVMRLAEIQCETGYDQIEAHAISMLLNEYGWVKQRMPKKENGRKYTVTDFVKVQQKKKSIDGIVISDRIFLNMAGHDTCVINGKCLDIWDCTNKEYTKCVGNYWVKGE